MGNVIDSIKKPEWESGISMKAIAIRVATLVSPVASPAIAGVVVAF